MSLKAVELVICLKGHSFVLNKFFNMSSLFEEDLFLKLAMNRERQNTIWSQSIFLNNFWPQQLIETVTGRTFYSHISFIL